MLRRSHGAGVVPSILEEGSEATGLRLEGLSPVFPLVEIRADRLRASDLEALIRRSPSPVIVTIRDREDGGRFDGTTEARREILEEALRAGAAYVDVEWRGPMRDWALRSFPGRVILSDHGAPCGNASLRSLYRRMSATPAARLKIVPRAGTAADALSVRDLLALARAEGRELASFALGARGAFTRIFALSWGSWATYASVAPSRPTGEGQLGVGDLLDTYDVVGLGPSTRRFALAGRGIGASPSPSLHRAAHRDAGLDAILVPLDVESPEDLLPLLVPLGIEGLAVTIPLKEAIARRSEPSDEIARAAGAVNTVRLEAGGWKGFNTDGPAARERIGRHVSPSGARVAIVGAGGTARAIAAALATAGSKVVLYGRTPAKTASAAKDLGVSARSLVELPGDAWDVLVQATPLGRDGEEVLPRRALRGKVVLDAVYREGGTPLVRDARAEGLAVVDGFDLLIAQAELQIEILTGCAVGSGRLEAALAAWRGERAAGSS